MVCRNQGVLQGNMRRFADLYEKLDGTTRTSVKLAALGDYFRQASPADAAWAVYFLTGRRLKRLVSAPKLRDWGAEAAGIPAWLFEESYHAVGDLAETLALLLPEPTQASPEPLHCWVEERLLPLADLEEAPKKAALFRAWASFDRTQRLVWNKLLTGSFRVGVAHGLVVRALAETTGLPVAVVAGRLMGDWRPTPAFFARLTSAEVEAAAEDSRPYPFLLAHPLEGEPAALGDLSEWQAEWKWDGIRAQLIRRGGDVHLWSRGEELMTARFPEIAEAAARLPEGTVLDGEILAWRGEGPLGFAALQKRIGRKQVTRRLQEQVPVAFLAFDLLEADRVDLRPRPLEERRARLEGTLAGIGPRLRVSPLVPADSWEKLAKERNESRSRGVEGVMLKRRQSAYETGRPRGVWWKWKVDPLSVDAVLLYAQLGHGRRASLYTDYTFGVWSEGQLVPFARAYSGLTDAEIREVDRWVRDNTLERFGPVRQVRPELVFEIAFEGIQRSPRHRAGVAVRFPRMVRRRPDKKAQDADLLERLRQLLPPTQGEDEDFGLYAAADEEAPTVGMQKTESNGNKH